MRAKKITYNLAGQGLLRTYVYPYTCEFYDFLKLNKYDAKFHFTNQLGALRNYLHGAHHTRYEYIILQWTLIHQLKEQKINIGLSSQRNNFGKLPKNDKYPSGGEILQCLSLLVNMGHFPNTFAASRAWLHLLKSNQSKVRTAFKAGIKSEDKVILEKIINDFDIYNIHLVNALFLLQRYKKIDNGKEYVEFGSKLIREYFTRDSKELNKLLNIYSIIRRLSYLILDSHYSPLPFNLDVSSIITNMDSIFNENMNNENSILINAINQIDHVLEDSLYMSGNSILTVSDCSKTILNQFHTNITDKNMKGRISIIRDLLEPKTEKSNSISDIFQEYNHMDFPRNNWNDSMVLELTYSNIKPFLNMFPQDIVEWEEEQRNTIGRCYIGFSFSPNKNFAKKVYALNKNLNNKKLLIKSLDIIKEVVKFEYSSIIYNYKNSYAVYNYTRIFSFLLNATFGTNKLFRLEHAEIKHSQKNPFFIGKGCIKVAKEIADYKTKATGTLNKDQLHEIDMVEKIVRQIKYKGHILVFAGSTKVFLDNANTESAQFDGIIYIPGKKNNDFLIVVEAKNKQNGNTQARNQLSKRLKKISPDFIKYDIKDFDNKAAYAKIYLTE